MLFSCPPERRDAPVNRHILLVEDNVEIQLANKDMLELLGYTVTLAMSLAEARNALKNETPDAIVLDIMLPDGSGLDFLAELRAHLQVPVLMLTAMGTPDDTVTGFSAGADDYIAKPYDYKVLAARIEALLRRAERMPETLQKGLLKLDIMASKAFLQGNDLLLTQKEFAMLLVFAQNEDKLVSDEYLYEKIWSGTFNDDPVALRNTVSRLRKKLVNSEYTVSVTRGEGYLFQ